MPELRKDPIIGRWVIIAGERAKRPQDFKVDIGNKESKVDTKDCPFCEGNEEKTPPEILAVRKPDTKPNQSGWKVRLVPSISGFLTPQGELDRHGKGIYDLMNGIGVHEVLVMTPEHTEDVYKIEEEQLTKAIGLLIQRLRQLREDKRLKYVLVYGNHGKPAGGSDLGHLHLQLIATPVTPKRVKEELAGTKRYYDYKDRCVICDMIKQELKDDERVVCRIGSLVAMTPFCSRFPFEIWIMPVKHMCDFDEAEDSYITDLSSMYKYIFGRMNKLLGDFPFNAILHTAPFRRRMKKGYWETIEQDYHWHIEIMPRLTRIAGFEWGSGFYINTVPPETACKMLKSVK